MTTTLLCYDAVTATNIPARLAQMVAGYDDGAYAWSQADWDLFPGVPHLHISVRANPASPCFDSETGNASPADVAKALFERNRNGLRSVVYCNTSSYPSQAQVFASAGVPRLAWDWWAANYSDGDVIPDQAIGVQYQGGITNPYDLSVMSEAWVSKFFGTAIPAASVAPTPTLEDIFNMITSDPELFVRWAYRTVLKDDLSDDTTYENNMKAITAGQSLGSIYEALLSSEAGKAVLAAERKLLNLS